MMRHQNDQDAVAEQGLAIIQHDIVLELLHTMSKTYTR
jgi:hypothetical protein